jgi:galactokinase
MRHSNTRLEHTSSERPSVQAFAPGRVNLVGEHTDYNDGLCLPFAIERGVTVRAEPAESGLIEANALDLAESASFALSEPGAAGGGAGGRARGGSAAAKSAAAEGATAGDAATWERFARGAAAELAAAGIALRPCRLEIAGDLPRDAGLSSSAALCVALSLALCAVAGQEPPGRVELARLCSRVENDWAGAQTGLLDQLAVLFGEPGRVVRIDMRGPELRSVPLDLGEHLLAVLDSGAPRSLAESGYNERREECRAACRALGVDSLRDAPGAEGLPDPLDRRVRHVLGENQRVDAAVAALGSGDLEALGELLDASHRSLRDDYEVSVPQVERAVEACKRAGALGARIVGGGFGGSVLALFPPGARPPAGAVAVRPAAGARLL